MVSPRVVVALALLAATDAFPFIQNEKRSFTITQVERRSTSGNFTIKTGAHAYAHSLRKYNAPESDIQFAERAIDVHLAERGVSASGSVPAYVPSYADVEYDCPVTIGTQTFKLDLDTGSSDL